MSLTLNIADRTRGEERVFWGARGHARTTARLDHGSDGRVRELRRT